MEFREKGKFFVNRSVPENFQWESTHGILTHSGFRKCIWKVGTTNFWPCFGRPKLGECDKMGSVSKIMSRQKKQIRPQFSKYRFQNESAWAHSLWAHADSIWSRNFENCGRAYFFERLIILLTDPILSYSRNFGRPKQGQTFVVTTFHIHFLNPECVRIPWVPDPKNFPLKIFGYGAIYKKVPFFTDFSCRLQKKSIGLVYPQFWCHIPSQ